MMSNMHQGTLFPTNKNPGALACATRTKIFFSDDIYIFKNCGYSRGTKGEEVGGEVSLIIGVSSKTILTTGEDYKSLSHTNFLFETF
jgi:hypothetical protein